MAYRDKYEAALVAARAELDELTRSLACITMRKVQLLLATKALTELLKRTPTKNF